MTIVGNNHIPVMGVTEGYNGTKKKIRNNQNVSNSHSRSFIDHSKFNDELAESEWSLRMYSWSFHRNIELVAISKISPAANNEFRRQIPLSIINYKNNPPGRNNNTRAKFYDAGNTNWIVNKSEYIHRMSTEYTHTT